MLLTGWEAPRSAFEDYHLLTAVRLHVLRFTRDEQQKVRDQVVSRLDSGWWPPGSDRRGVARRILEQIGG